MNKQELEQALADARNLLAQYESELATAKAEQLEECRRDSERDWGSDRQERLREEHQQELKNAVYRCEKNVNHQKNVVANLEQQLAVLN